MYVRTLDTQGQSVIEVSVVAVDDVSPSSAGGLSEVRELVGVHAVVAPHCLTATEALTQLHIPAQGERGRHTVQQTTWRRTLERTHALHRLYVQVTGSPVPIPHCKCN